MPTYRADIDVANDNRRRKKRMIWLLSVTFICALLAFGYFQTRYYLMNDLPDLPDKRTMWQLNLKPNMTLLDKDGRVIGHRGKGALRLHNSSSKTSSSRRKSHIDVNFKKPFWQGIWKPYYQSPKFLNFI